jgi:hypothetical protein
VGANFLMVFARLRKKHFTLIMLTSIVRDSWWILDKLWAQTIVVLHYGNYFTYVCLHSSIFIQDSGPRCCKWPRGGDRLVSRALILIGWEYILCSLD